MGQWPVARERGHRTALRVALDIVRLLGEYEGPATIRAWWIGTNPGLGDEAPLQMLAQDPQRVHEAAVAFLAQRAFSSATPSRPLLHCCASAAYQTSWPGHPIKSSEVAASTAG